MRLNVPRRFVTAFLAVILIPSLAACATSLKWTEDVKLPDGRIVVLTRYQEFQGPTELGQPPTESDYWLEFNNPDNRERVRWNGHRDLATVALLMDEGIPQLLMTPWLGGAERTYLCPDPLYLLYRYEAGEWKHTPLITLHGRRIRPNVTVSPSVHREEIRTHGNHLDWQMSGGRVPGARVPGTNIDFRELKEQTFGMRCDPPFNMMEEKRERK